jgi:hypothetical protein
LSLIKGGTKKPLPRYAVERLSGSVEAMKGS